MRINASEMLIDTGGGLRKLGRFGHTFIALTRAHGDGNDDEYATA